MKNNIKVYRQQLGLTQLDLANKINVTRQTIGLIEKGNYNPSLKLCISIAKALHTTLDTLFWEDDFNE